MRVLEIQSLAFQVLKPRKACYNELKRYGMIQSVILSLSIPLAIQKQFIVLPTLKISNHKLQQHVPSFPNAVISCTKEVTFVLSLQDTESHQ